MKPEQLTFSLSLRDDALFANFVVGENTLCVQALRSALQGVGGRHFFLWGKPGCGKTHLLQALCHQAHHAGQTAFYLSLAEPERFSPEILEDLENCMVLAIDDIDGVAGLSSWEEALFHVFNRTQSQHRLLIMTASQPAYQAQFKLADLISRLQWGEVYQLKHLSEADTLRALCLRAKRRGMKLKPVVAQFMLKRCSRNMNELINTLDVLDKASLVAKRTLTIPFVKEILQI